MFAMKHLNHGNLHRDIPILYRSFNCFNQITETIDKTRK